MCPRHLRIPGGQDNREDRTHMPMRVNRENRSQPNQPQTECLCALEQRTLYPVCLHAAGGHIAKTKAPISILATGQGTRIKLPDIAAAIRQVRAALQLPSRPLSYFSSDQKKPREGAGGPSINAGKPGSGKGNSAFK